MDLSLIQGTITGLKFAGDLAKSLLELKTMAEVQGKVIELQSAILSAQSSALSANADQAAMIEEIRALKEEIARVKAWETEKQRYELKSPFPGSAVYALKKSMSRGEPAHYICANCYEQGKRSILQNARDKEAWTAFACSSCKS
ncbi:MAG TPA: hypothetical protein VEI29_04690, partial [Burkholderiaceae bacterium]|nr:hypothetical protein [Burkholderiaceae bacterium]